MKKRVRAGESVLKQLWLFNQIADQAMVLASPAVSGNLVVIAAQDHNAYALDLATGQLRWKFPTAGPLDASPLIAGPRVYLASQDRRLYVLDLTTGKKLWQFTVAAPLTATPAIGRGVIVLADTAGTVYCLQPKP